MGLRLAEGVDISAIEQRFGRNPIDWNSVERLVRSGHLSRSKTRIRLTDSGRLLLDHILGEIAAAIDPRPSVAGAPPPELPGPPAPAWPPERAHSTPP